MSQITQLAPLSRLPKCAFVADYPIVPLSQITQLVPLSSFFLQVTRTTITSWMGSKFGKDYPTCSFDSDFPIVHLSQIAQLVLFSQII